MINVNGKPTIIQYYNENKRGVYSFVQLGHSFTVSRKTKRQPTRIFMKMLDMAVRNAKILLKFKNTGRNVKISPQSSVKEFYMHLCKDYLIERFNMS